MEPLSWLEIFAAMAGRFLPVWVALVVTFVCRSASSAALACTANSSTAPSA